jgi:hypothetical protein
MPVGSPPLAGLHQLIRHKKHEHTYKCPLFSMTHPRHWQVRWYGRVHFVMKMVYNKVSAHTTSLLCTVDHRVNLLVCALLVVISTLLLRLDWVLDGGRKRKSLGSPPSDFSFLSSGIQGLHVSHHFYEVGPDSGVLSGPVTVPKPDFGSFFRLGLDHAPLPQLLQPSCGLGVGHPAGLG